MNKKYQKNLIIIAIIIFILLIGLVSFLITKKSNSHKTTINNNSSEDNFTYKLLDSSSLLYIKNKENNQYINSYKLTVIFKNANNEEVNKLEQEYQLNKPSKNVGIIINTPTNELGLNFKTADIELNLNYINPLNTVDDYNISFEYNETQTTNNQTDIITTINNPHTTPITVKYIMELYKDNELVYAILNNASNIQPNSYLTTENMIPPIYDSQVPEKIKYNNIKFIVQDIIEEENFNE